MRALLVYCIIFRPAWHACALNRFAHSDTRDRHRSKSLLASADCYTPESEGGNVLRTLALEEH